MRIFQYLSLSFLLITLPLTSFGEEAVDPYLWLEDIESEKALEWAEARNSESLAILENLPEYKTLYDKNLTVYDSEERIAYPSIRGDYLYNFWRDAVNERGLWRRTTFEKYAKDEPHWETLIDLDVLAKAEDENWVWHGASCLHPKYDRCLVSLSRGGADADVTREFDIPSRSFVKDGFYLPESKGGASFIDYDTVFVGTNFGDGSMTESAYPRITKLWKRGTPLSEAKVLYEGTSEDIGVFSYLAHTVEKDYPLIVVAPTFFSNIFYLLRDGELKKLDIPEDANIETIFQNQLLIALKSDWQRDGETWKQGALVSVDIDDLLNGKNPTLIYAYGGFEVSMRPRYSATIGMDWLDNGGVYVLANIRGGGEYGPAWHKIAQRENRQRSYADFYAVAEDVISNNITSPRHLGIRGGSGGGLLVGMLFTQRPELFHGVVCQVPLLDMQRFDKLLAGASWVEEYGDPDNPEDWAWLQNYSPYHNLDKDKDYPRVFFTTSTRDDRVHPGHEQPTAFV